MPPVTSNHGGSLPGRETSTVEKKGFQKAPVLSPYRIGAIYTIRLKMVYLDHFRLYYVELGDRVQTALER